MQTITRRLWILVAAALVLGASHGLAADDEKEQKKKEKEMAKIQKDLPDLKERVAAAREALIKRDSSLKKYFDESEGYVIFPQIGKGGFIFAGAHGKGLVYERGRLVGHASISQATVGAQIGGQVYREVIFFENTDTLKAFKESKVELNAQATAVAAAEGAAANADYSEGVLVFTDPIKGLMAEASVGGQKFKYTALP